MQSLLTSARGPAGRRAARRAAGCAGVLALAAAAACTENLNSGAACAAQLCPVTNEAVRDTVLEPVVLDTALAGVPVAGDPSVLLLAVRPGADSLDVRAVFRYDTLPARYAPSGGGDSVAITTVRSSALRLRLDTAGTSFGAARARVPGAPLTLEAYNVDTAAAVDTVPAVLATLFRPARLLGRVTLPAGTAVPDSVRIPISTEAFGARAGRRLRVGVRLVSTEPAQLRVFSARASGVLGAAAPQLRFVPATDTATRELSAFLLSDTPGERTFAAAYVNQNVVVRAPFAPAAADIVVGGLPARRAYLRFAVPARFVDSVSLVRATLELTQRPSAAPDPLDSVTVRPLAVLATDAVTDLSRASEIAAPNGIPSFRLAPGAGGLREVSVVQLLAGWRVLPAGTQRALVLRAEGEGVQPAEVRFYSVEAAPGLRPRLRLSYIPRTNFGLP
jgi:hypothetical protein